MTRVRIHVSHGCGAEQHAFVLSTRLMGLGDWVGRDRQVRGQGALVLCPVCRRGGRVARAERFQA